MIPLDAALAKFRRDLFLASVLRLGLVGGAVLCLLAAPALGQRDGSMLFVLSFLIGFVWIYLGYQSMRGARLAADSPALIAAGQFEQAESRITAALETFSLFRTSKLMNLHHLALLRHAQRRWRETAVVCQALLGRNLGRLQGLARTAWLMLADALLHQDDLPGTYDAISRLRRQRLNLGQTITLQLIELDYGSRIGAWEAMLAGARLKVQLAELMPPVNSCLLYTSPSPRDA